VNTAAAFILNRMLHSIYTRDIVVSLISMENNQALETLSRLCLPPTNANTFVNSSLGIWKALATNINTFESTDYIATNPIPTLMNMVEIDKNPKAVPNLKKHISTILAFCQKDKLLTLKIDEATLKLATGGGVKL